MGTASYSHGGDGKPHPFNPRLKIIITFCGTIVPEGEEKGGKKKKRKSPFSSPRHLRCLN